MSHRLDPLEAKDFVVRRPGRPDRDWWAPIVNDRLLVMIRDEIGSGSEQTTMDHRVVVCEDRETAHRYAVWHCHVNGLSTDTPISEVYWPRYLDGLELVTFDELMLAMMA